MRAEVAVRSSWRIVKARHAAHAFDGEGARRNGGRWNSPGTAMVYTAGSASLAILELLVHVPSPELLPSFVMIECRFDPSLAIALQQAVLPKKWRVYPAPRELQSIGARWVEQGQSAILEVPSAVVPQEQNFLLNPAHTQFGRIEILEPRALDWDPRLLK